MIAIAVFQPKDGGAENTKNFQYVSCSFLKDSVSTLDLSLSNHYIISGPAMLDGLFTWETLHECQEDMKSQDLKGFQHLAENYGKKNACFVESANHRTQHGNAAKLRSYY
jgi:hypothetical protein